jgi:molybdopterin converting factor small subunit
MSTLRETTQAEELLTQRLKQDTNGQTLRELIEQLAASAKQVEESLDQPHTAEEQEILQHLAEAIRTGDAVLQRLWTQFHKRPVML